MNEENSLLTGAVRPALLRYALPIILSMVATQFYAVADTMIIGLRLDADALAAVSNASTVLMIFLFISGGMELGGGLLVAAGKPTATKHEMTELLYNLLFVDEVIALLTTAVGFVTLPALLRLINTPAEILDTAVLYGRIYLMGLPFLMPYDLSKECVMGCGDSKTPLKVIVATSAMNIVLDLVLVGPFGVAGAAAATAAAQVAGAVYMVAFLRRTQMDAAFSFRMLKARYARDIFRLSAPNSIQQASGTIITTVKTLLRRPSTWVWGALFPIALSTMFMFMFANLSSGGTVDPVPVAVVADEAWDASTFKDVATSLDEEGDDQLLEIHECDDAADANRALKAGEVAGIYTVDAEGAPKLTLLSSYDSSRASSVLTDRSILETVASSYTQNAELMSQIAQDNPAALADPEAVARALSLEGGTRRVSLTRTTPDGTVIYYYALFGLVAMMSAEFAALSVVDLQPNLSGLGARRCVGGLSKTASLAGIFVGSWLVSFASMAIAIGYVRLVVGVDFGGREGLCLVGGAASALAATGLGLFVGTLPVKGGKAFKSGILTGFATTCALFAGLYGEPAMALADDVARACPAECWLNPVKLICDMFNRLYFFEDLGPFAVRAGALVLMALLFVATATLIFGRSRYEHL